MNVENTIRYAGIYATKPPNKAAIIIAETQQSLSYKDLHEYALKFVNIYDSFGLLYGDHVAFLTENRIECPALQCGAHYAGLYYTFINTRLKLPEVLYIVEDCDAKNHYFECSILYSRIGRCDSTIRKKTNHIRFR